MLLNAYISGASAEYKRAADLAARAYEGDIFTPDQWWTDPSFSGRDHEHAPDERRRITRMHFAYIETCDVFWFLAPNKPHHSRMAWCELGYAQAQGRALPIIVSGEFATASVCTSLSDRLFLTDDEALAYVLDLARKS